VDSKKWEIVRETYEAIQAGRDQVAEHFLKNVFLRYPDVKPLFGEVPLNRQVKLVLDFLDTAVKGLGETEEVQATLKKTGDELQLHGVSSSHYEAIGLVWFSTLQHFFEEQWTREVEDEWISFVEYVVSSMRCERASPKLKLSQTTAPSEEKHPYQIAHAAAQELLDRALQEVKADVYARVREEAKELLIRALEDEVSSAISSPPSGRSKTSLKLA